MKGRNCKGLLLSVLTIVSFFGVSACSGKGEMVTDTVGGATSENEVTYTVSGLEDVHIASFVSEYDFTEKPLVTFSNGRKEKFTCDSSAVKFGVPGEYEIVFTYEHLKYFQSVFVYAEPTFIYPQGDLSLSYGQVYFDLTEGFEAKDSFGNPLDVFLLDDGGLYQEDGTAKIGTFDVEYAAVDRAGQKKSVRKKLTVRNPQGVAPQIQQEVVYDVVEEGAEIGFSLNGGLMAGLSIGERLLNKKDYSVQEGKIRISGDYLYDQFGTGTFKTRLITSEGVAEGILRVCDEKSPAIDCFGMNGWVFTVGEEGVLPVPQKLYDRQDFRIEYSLISPSGKTVVTEGFPSFIPKEKGEYVLKAEAVRKNGEKTEKRLTLKAYTAEEMKKLYYAADSLQFANERVKIGSGIEAESAEFVYTEEIVGERTGSWKLTSRLKDSPWYARVDFTDAKLTSGDISSYSYLVFDFYIESPVYMVAWGADVYYLEGWGDNFKVYDYEKNEYKSAEKSDFYGKWVKGMIRIDNFAETVNYREVRLGLKDCGNLYINNIRFE